MGVELKLGEIITADRHLSLEGFYKNRWVCTLHEAPQRSADALTQKFLLAGTERDPMKVVRINGRSELLPARTLFLAKAVDDNAHVINGDQAFAIYIIQPQHKSA